MASKFKKGDLVKIPKRYLRQDLDQFKMVRKIYKLGKTVMLELQGKIFTQDLPADEVELWIKA